MNIQKVLIQITILLLCYNNAFTQQKEPSYATVNWKVGTSKRVTHIDSTIVYSNDTLLLATAVNSHYTIKIVSLKDQVYEVRFQQITIDKDFHMVSDVIDMAPAERIIQEILVALQMKMANFEYSFLVDKNTALAYEVKNQNEMKQFVAQTIEVFFNQFLNQSDLQLTQTEKQEIKLKINQNLEQQMPAAMETMMNAFNYIFQAYSFPYIIGETYTQKVEVYDVDQMKTPNQTADATLVVNSAITNSELQIDYKYIYDKEKTYQSYVVDQGKAAEVSLADFDIEERVASNFDIKTSWIKSSSSYVKAKMGRIHVINNTYVTFK